MSKLQLGLVWVAIASLILIAGKALFDMVFQSRYPPLISWDRSRQFDLVSPTFVSGKTAQLYIYLGDTESVFTFKSGDLETTVKLSGHPEIYTEDVSEELNDSLSKGKQGDSAKYDVSGRVVRVCCPGEISYE